MSDKVFSAENVVVEIYLDDGSGSPVGAALFTFTYKRAASMSLSTSHEQLPHAGYEFDEISPGKARFMLDLARVVDSRTKDLRLSEQLYYIRVINNNDDWSAWDRYNCIKCRRITWEMPITDRGVLMARSRFACEQIIPEAVP